MTLEEFRALDVGAYIKRRGDPHALRIVGVSMQGGLGTVQIVVEGPRGTRSTLTSASQPLRDLQKVEVF